MASQAMLLHHDLDLTISGANFESLELPNKAAVLVFVDPTRKHAGSSWSFVDLLKGMPSVVTLDFGALCIDARLRLRGDGLLGHLSDVPSPGS